jgi:hypothetical protein
MKIDTVKIRKFPKILTKSGKLGSVGFLLLLGASPGWAGPPNPTSSDNLGNTAGGSGVLINNQGSWNTGFGFSALGANTAGFGNTATGFNTLLHTTNGSLNTADGLNALLSNTAGVWNTAGGVNALFSNDAGNFNTAFGAEALLTNTEGSFNTAIGAFADVSAGTYTNATALGYGAQAIASNSIVLGNNIVSKIYANVTTITGISDRRRKKDITGLEADLGLDLIQKLQPVSYRYNNGDDTLRYGFIAQDLEQALPVSLQNTVETAKPEHGLALIERGTDKDRTYRVAYGELIAPMVKAIQEEQQEITAERRQNANLQQQNAELRKAVAGVSTDIAALKAQNDALRHAVEGLKQQVSAGSVASPATIKIKD